MTELVGYLLLFLAVGAGFIFIHLVAGKLFRPIKPDAEKLTIYECGEPTIGSAWIQFDLRFYVVALLFVIFDVEVAFFFPWAVVFGKANTIKNSLLSSDRDREEYIKTYEELGMLGSKAQSLKERLAHRKELLSQKPELEARNDTDQLAKVDAEIQQIDRDFEESRRSVPTLAWLAFWDILVFFGVLLVGFAYLWRRGDLNWVRSTAAERIETSRPEKTAVSGTAPTLVGSGRDLW
jgi:NADH-quinone oxidoreductase subunit A